MSEHEGKNENGEERKGCILGILNGLLGLGNDTAGRVDAFLDSQGDRSHPLDEWKRGPTGNSGDTSLDNGEGGSENGQDA